MRYFFFTNLTYHCCYCCSVLFGIDNEQFVYYFTMVLNGCFWSELRFRFSLLCCQISFAAVIEVVESVPDAAGPVEKSGNSITPALRRFFPETWLWELVVRYLGSGTELIFNWFTLCLSYC